MIRVFNVLLDQFFLGHPDYDPRNLYIPPSAWRVFTPFEKQFWEIKSKHFDTVVFFKKGKFYELYEQDADIGHREFDLKMTDRVNMRMVGVPEASFDFWAAKFIAANHKVAKVDQLENAVGKSMRERQGDGKEEKIIRRELTAILTSGTLTDPGLLTTPMATYCMAIKVPGLGFLSSKSFFTSFSRNYLVQIQKNPFTVCVSLIRLQLNFQCAILKMTKTERFFKP